MDVNDSHYPLLTLLFDLKPLKSFLDIVIRLNFPRVQIIIYKGPRLLEHILFRSYLETISTMLSSEVGACGRALSSEIGGKSCGMSEKKAYTLVT